MTVQELLQHKELGLWDFGCVKMVRPTGRYIHSEYGDMIEVKRGMFGASKQWVSPNLLQVVRTKEAA